MRHGVTVSKLSQLSKFSQLCSKLMPEPLLRAEHAHRSCNETGVILSREVKLTCSRQEPRATPSKNWWKVNAASNGRIVQGELLTPSAMPISTEWKAIPVSSTCRHMQLHSQHLPTSQVAAALMQKIHRNSSQACCRERLLTFKL